MLRFNSAVFIGLWLCCVGWAHAQETLPPVIVSAPIIQAHSADPEYTTGQARVLRREDFRGHHHTLADVLAELPEVQVQRRGELGSFSSISVRGAPSRQTLVFVNGIQVPTAEGDSINLAQYLLSDIEAIEVYATAPPGQMAQAGIGGAINIITRNASGTSTASSATLQAGSFGTLGVSAQHHFPWQRWQFQLKAHRWSAENDFPYVFDGGTPNNPDNFQHVKRNNAGYIAQGVSLDAMHVGENQQWEAQLGVNTRDKEIPTWNNRDISDTNYASTQLHSALGWSSSSLLDGLVNASVRVFGQQTTGNLTDSSGVLSFGGLETEDETRALGIVPVISGSVGEHWLTLAGDVRRESFVLRRAGQSPESDFVRHAMAWSVTDEWMPWPIDLTVLMNLRLQGFADASVDQGNDSGAEQQTDADTLWGGQLGLRWQWSTHGVAKTNITQAHRIPTLFERFGNQGSFRGNTSLIPEMAHAWDISLAGKSGPLLWDVAHFLRYSRNAIAPVYNSQGIGRYENIGNAWFQGIEWRVDWPWAWESVQGKVGSSGSLQRSIIESSFLAYNGNQVPGYYPITSRFYTTVVFRRTQMEAEWTDERGLFFDRANSTQAPDKHYLNLTVRQDIPVPASWQQHRLEFSARNVLDHAAMDFNRSPLPGRSFFITYNVGL